MKPALVCKLSDLPEDYNSSVGIALRPIHEGFWDIKSFIADRAQCEADNSLQQFLPYVTVINEKKQIFVYSRGKGGAEARLIGNLSIGLGGHVDEAVPEGLTLYQWLQMEGERELLEEACIGLYGQNLQFLGLIRDTTNPVGLVHMGLLAIHHIHSDTVVDLEAEIIENGQWLTLAEIFKPEVCGRMENWSKVVLYKLHLMEAGADFGQIIYA